MSYSIGKIKNSLQDARSGRLIFLTHCILNQNACVQGLAAYPAVVKPLVLKLLEGQVGLYQMPCPEVSYLGSQRWGHVKEQYGNPMFRRHCRRLAEGICDQIQTYRDNHHEVLGVVFRDGSPTCGFKCAAVSADAKQVWGGMVWNACPLQAFAPTKGVFVEELEQEMKTRGVGDVPLLSIPEVDEAGSMEESIQTVLKACENREKIRA
jgi:predicted secreted protein